MIEHVIPGGFMGCYHITDPGVNSTALTMGEGFTSAYSFIRMDG
jgi:hypothetical protein